MDRDELLTEINRLKRLLTAATRQATAHYKLIDKLTAANLRVTRLMKKLEVQREKE